MNPQRSLLHRINARLDASIGNQVATNGTAGEPLGSIVVSSGVESILPRAGRREIPIPTGRIVTVFPERQHHSDRTGTEIVRPIVPAAKRAGLLLNTARPGASVPSALLRSRGQSLVHFIVRDRYAGEPR